MSKPALLVLSTFSVHPPVFGGQVRLWNLYSRLSAWFKVTILAYDPHLVARQDFRFTSSLRAVSVPISDDDRGLLLGAMERTGLFTHDIQCAYRYGLTEAFRAELQMYAARSDYLICSHPYFAPRFAHLGTHDASVNVYDAVDCEIAAKQSYLTSEDPLCDELRSETVSAESLAYTRAHLVVACSESDMNALKSHYGNPRGFSGVVRNGTDVNAVTLRTNAERRKIRASLGLGDVLTLCFIGSGYYANVESLRRVIPALQATRQPVNLILIGDCAKDAPESLSENLRIFRMGRVSVEMKDLMLGCADIALHLIFSGSGTTLKLFDYMASGLPVIGTALGFRGVPEASGLFIEVSDEHALLDAVAAAKRNATHLEDRGRRGRPIIEQFYSWDVIAGGYRDALMGKTF